MNPDQLREENATLKRCLFHTQEAAKDLTQERDRMRLDILGLNKDIATLRAELDEAKRKIRVYNELPALE